LKNKNHPFLLKPSAKDYLWGGNRLNDDFNKQIDMSPLAETWECSTHPDGPSYVASGKYKGKSLIEILKKYPEYLGTHPRTDGELPILVKFIDAKKDLSIQVHPSDEYANEYENGQLGKTEMWYVLDATKKATLVHGFNCDMTKDVVKKAIENDTIEKYLNKVSVHKDDLFFIDAGTVHAIGAGTLIAEIQENSNLTYRLYDYNRVDKNGNLRELHLDKALNVMNFKPSKDVKQPMRVHNYKNGYSSELLCRCKYFEVHKQKINTENCKGMYSFQTKSNSFHILLCINGCGTIISNNEILHFFKGDCIFVPANSVELKIHGMADLLDVSC
jgi:mannose-6-phosphate isomerase